MTTDQTPTAAELREAADRIIFSAMNLMVETGIPFQMMMDRMLTAAAAHIANHQGAEATASVLRLMADNVDKGALVAVERRTTAN